jgi:hypothetical protein
MDIFSFLSILSLQDNRDDPIIRFNGPVQFTPALQIPYIFVMPADQLDGEEHIRRKKLKAPGCPRSVRHRPKPVFCSISLKFSPIPGIC